MSSDITHIMNTFATSSLSDNNFDNEDTNPITTTTAKTTDEWK
ncbi:MAG: hypothetical protein WKF36_10915 [Candidatus Nitrosocosmicus sp.]